MLYNYNMPKLASKIITLGIETSCDETSASLVKFENGRLSVLSNVVSSQADLHAKWGGVVPNLAAREHLKNILPVIEKSLEKAGIAPPEIDLLAVTKGPGLIPALLVGTSTAKSLAYSWKKPLIGIHHIEGHIYSNFTQIEKNQILFPVLCLVISGGHTQLVLMRDHFTYEIVGETQDDAVGEAFDKVARILDLGYPGGPAISKIASSYKETKNPWRPKLPRPMINSDNLNFSFSGLKTAVLYLVKENKKNIQDQKFIKAVAKEFQDAAAEVLISKTLKAAKKYGPKTIMLAGGVSANKKIREDLGKAIELAFPDSKYLIPEIDYTGDNAAMIAVAGTFRFLRDKNPEHLKNNWKTLETRADLKLE